MDHLTKNSKNWTPGTPFFRLCVGLLITLLAFIIRKLIHPWVQPSVPFHFVVFGAIVTEFFVGMTAAFSGLGIGMALAFYFFVQPYGVFTLFKVSDVIIIANNLIVASTAILLLEYLQRANYSNKLNSQVANSQRRSLVEVYNLVLFQQRKSQAFVNDITSTFASIADVLWLIPIGRKPYPMPALHRLTNAKVPFSYQASWNDMIYPEDQPMMEKELYALEHLPDSTQKTLRFRLNTEDGTERWVDGLVKAIHYRQQWHMWLVIAKDMSSQRRRADD